MPWCFGLGSGLIDRHLDVFGVAGILLMDFLFCFQICLFWLWEDGKTGRMTDDTGMEYDVDRMPSTVVGNNQI